jgi:hypothetical protein
MYKSFTSFIISLLCSGMAGAASYPLSCQLDKHTVSVLTSSSYPDMDSFTLVIDGKSSPAFEPLPDGEDYVIGGIEYAACEGGVYTLVVNYGPPYMKSFALRSNPATGQIERLNFAEKSVPRYAVNMGERFQVVLPNENAEPRSRYIVYTAGKELSTQQNKLPTGPLIKLPPNQHVYSAAKK